MTSAAIHIQPGPTVEIARKFAGSKWCFHCRARLPHDDKLMNDPPERQPSYYDPVWARCGGDHTRFPGV